MAEDKTALSKTNQEQSAVIGRLAPADALFEYRFRDALQATHVIPLDNRLKAAPTKFFAFGINNLDQPIGENQQKVAGANLALISMKFR